ncbi:MAG: hypothetical protein AABX11_03970 [Nanoarchaeota archaeon]
MSEMEGIEKMALVTFVSSVVLMGFILLFSFVPSLTGLVIGNEEGNQALVDEGCSDSDGGLNYQISGSVNLCIKGNCDLAEDSCSGKVLVEYYCEEEKRLSKKYDCEEMCESGACANKVSKFSYRGGGGSADEGLVTTTTTTSVPSTSQTYELGNIVKENIVDVLKDDKTYFTIGGNEYFVTLVESSPTQAEFIVSGLPKFTLGIGESVQKDLDSDGDLDATFWLRSVNVITNKAKLSIS